MITQRMKSITWWNALSIKQKESWVRLMMPEYRKFDALTGSEIQEIYKIYLMELQEAAMEYYLENIEGEPLDQDTPIECFVAGCEYILNKQNFT